MSIKWREKVIPPPTPTLTRLLLVLERLSNFFLIYGSHKLVQNIKNENKKNGMWIKWGERGKQACNDGLNEQDVENKIDVLHWEFQAQIDVQVNFQLWMEFLQVQTALSVIKTG